MVDNCLVDKGLPQVLRPSDVFSEVPGVACCWRASNVDAADTFFLLAWCLTERKADDIFKRASVLDI